ncbi:MAG: hypothetical protein PHT49_08185 [Desulfovibrionales bacterium]|nr:hypothetical protein [Desulfovibrionales bacterium]
MPTLYIRDISASAYRKLKLRARRHRRALTQEAATILEKALEEPEKETDIWAEMDAIKESIYTRLGSLGDSAPLIREDREIGLKNLRFNRFDSKGPTRLIPTC